MNHEIRNFRKQIEKLRNFGGQNTKNNFNFAKFVNIIYRFEVYMVDYRV